MTGGSVAMAGGGRLRYVLLGRAVRLVAGGTTVSCAVCAKRARIARDEHLNCMHAACRTWYCRTCYTRMRDMMCINCKQIMTRCVSVRTLLLSPVNCRGTTRFNYERDSSEEITDDEEHDLINF
jgi:hypothetical protein